MQATFYSTEDRNTKKYEGGSLEALGLVISTQSVLAESIMITPLTHVLALMSH